MGWSTERKTKAGFALASIVVAATGVISLRARQKESAANHWVSHTLEVLAELDITLLRITDAESGQRGYTITGDERFLVPCQIASEHIHQDIQRLQQITADNPIQQERIPALKKAIDDEMDSIKDTVESRRTRGLDPASRLIASGKGVIAMDAVRRVISDMSNIENELLRVRNIESERSNFQAAVTVYSLALLIIALVLTTYLLLRRDLLARTKMERAISTQYETARALAESSTLAEAMVKILRVLGEDQGWDLGDFWAIDCKTGAMRLAETWHLANTQFPAFDAATAQATFAPGVGLLGRGLNSGRVLCIGDLAQDRNFTRAASAARDGLRSAIVIPITLRGEVLAIMEFFSRKLRKPEDFMPITASAIGSQIGQFVDRIRGEEDLQEASRKLSVWVQDLERHASEITLLSQLGSVLQSCLIIPEASKVIAQFGPQLFPQSSGGVFVTAPSRDMVESVAQWGDPSGGEQVFAPHDCWALRSGRPNYADSLTSPMLCSHVSRTKEASSLCVPMMAQGESLGILHLHWRRESPAQPGIGPALDNPSKQQLALAVAEQLGLALANLRLRDALRSQSIRDPLTNLYNRRYMEESLSRELQRASRNGRPLGTILLDIDHFKRYNDTFGHEAGDAVLRELGIFITSHVRGEDIACRFGGEEFVLILPDTTLEITGQRADLLCEGVKHLNVTHHGQSLGAITISLGVSEFPEHGNNVATLVSAADKALYLAKERGRNQVVALNAIPNPARKASPPVIVEQQIDTKT